MQLYSVSRQVDVPRMLLKILLTLASCLLATCEAGMPRFGIPVLAEEQVMKFPFKDCKHFKLGGTEGVRETDTQVLKNGSRLALYPLIDDETTLNMYIMFKDVSFNIMIEPSAVSLLKCDSYLGNCQYEGSDSVKNSNSIKPHMWNQVHVTLDNQELKIYIGDLMVKPLLMVDEERVLDDPTWKVVIPPNRQRQGRQDVPHNMLYLVQFNCRDEVFQGRQKGGSNRPRLNPGYKYSHDHADHEDHDHSDEPEPVFEGCDTFKLGGMEGAMQTSEQDLNNGSSLAFYPATDRDTMLNLNLMLKDVIFDVIIEGSMVTLKKCDKYFKDCKTEGLDSAKYSNYVEPLMWNQVYVTLDNHMLYINVGQRMVKSMSMIDYEPLGDISWRVVVHPQRQISRDVDQPYYLYFVQFHCDDDYKRYDTTTYAGDITPERHIEITTVSPHALKEKNKLIGLVVGLVVGFIILLALAIVLYNVVQKRKSANITNENTGLQPAKK